MTLHHVGIVVENIETYGEAYRTFLGMTADSEVTYDPVQKVRVQFWKDARGNLLELIEPSAPDSPARRALSKGGGLNHLCYEVDDIGEQIRTSLEQGAVPASEIAPATAFSGRRIVFLFFPKLNLIEFLERG